METLLGRILSLVVTALAIVGGYEVYSNAMSNSHVQSLEQQLTQFQQNIVMQYQRRPGRYAFGTLTTGQIIANGLAPSSAINNGTLTNPFNGTFVINGSNTLPGGPIPPTVFDIAADQIPVEDCIKAIETYGTGGGLNNGPFYGYAVQGGDQNLTLPDTDTNAATQCRIPATPTVMVHFFMNG